MSTPAAREAEEGTLLAALRDAYPDMDIRYYPTMGWVASPKGAPVRVASSLVGLGRKLSAGGGGEADSR